MYPRNAASPERVAIGPIVQISDGAVQTSGVSVKVKPQGSAASAGGGTTSYEEGIVAYLPTQAETDYTSFQVIAYKTGCIPAAVTVVTSASATAGYAGTDQGKITNATSTVNLSGTTIKTATDVETDTADIQARLPAALVGGRIDANVGAISSDATAAENLEAALDGTGGVTITAALTGNITGNLSGSVGSVAAGGITASSIAADAAAEIAAAVRTELTTELARVDVATSTRASAADLATVAGYLDTEIAAILADTNELQTDWANGGRLDLILDTAAAAGGLTAADVWAEAFGGYAASDLLQLLAAVSFGKTTITDLGGGAATVIFRDVADTKDSVTADMNGAERTTITLDP